MAEVVITMSGDEAKLWKAQARILEQQKKLSGGYGELAGKSKVSAKAAREEAAARVKAEREHQKELAKGKALTESLRSPQERYNASVAESAELQKKGSISAETHRRRVEQLSSELASATGETARASRVQKARVEVLARSGKMTQDVERHLKEYAATLKQLDAKQKAGKISAEELAHAQGKARKEFDGATGAAGKQSDLLPGLTKNLAAYASGAGAAAGVVAILAGHWAKLVEQQEKGRDALKAIEDGERRLAQLAKTPEENDKLNKISEGYAKNFGVDMQVAQDLVFDAKSQKFEAAVDDILRARFVLDPKASAGVAGQVPALFGGEINSEQALSLLHRASTQSIADFEELARVMPTAAEGAVLAGSGPAEAAGLLSVLRGQYSTADRAATSISTFGAAISTNQATLSQEDYAELVEKEKKRVAASEKMLRGKEERVVDLEGRLVDAESRKASAGTKSARESAESQLLAVQTQLARARREVAEFDKQKLQFKTPDRGFEALGRIGIVEAAKILQADDARRLDFLGENKELNIAYEKITSNLADIESETAANEKDLRLTLQGGGSLASAVKARNANPVVQATLRNDIARQRDIAKQREVFGISGMNADTAEAIAREQTKGEFSAEYNGLDVFTTRAFGRTLGESVARGGTSLGLDPGTAGGLGAEVTRATGNPMLYYNQRMLELFGNVASKMGGAADKLSGTADTMREAAQPPRKGPAAPTPSVTDAARIQAGQSVRGD